MKTTLMMASHVEDWLDGVAESVEAGIMGTARELSVYALKVYLDRRNLWQNMVRFSKILSASLWVANVHSTENACMSNVLWS